MNYRIGLGMLMGAVTLLAAAGHLAGITTSAFSDRTHSVSAPTVTAATLPAPFNLETELNDGAPPVTVTWNAAPGDFAEAYEVFRYVESCPVPWPPDPIGTPFATVGNPPTPPPTMYVDGSAQPGSTYCYAVRGAAGTNWRSPLSEPVEVGVPFATTRLFLHTGPVLRASPPGTGSYSFGCLLGAFGACVTLSPDSRTYEAQTTYNVPANTGWHTSLRLESSLAVLVSGTVTITVDTWYVVGSCGALPSPTSSNRIASGSLSINLPTVNLSAITGTYPISLTANPNFVEPPGLRTLCMRVHSNHPGLIQVGLLAFYDLVHGSNSWLDGPFSP